MTYDPITQRDLDVEKRLTRLETTVEDIKGVITQARPQLALISALGSGAGAIIVGVVIWWVTKG